MESTSIPFGFFRSHLELMQLKLQKVSAKYPQFILYLSKFRLTISIPVVFVTKVLMKANMQSCAQHVLNGSIGNAVALLLTNTTF